MRLNACILAAILGVVLVSVCDAKTIPNFLTVCRRSNPHFDDCVKNSIMASRSHLANGIPRLHVPPAVPFVISELVVDRDLENFHTHLNVTNLRVHGVPQFVLKSFKTDLSRLELAATVMFPRLDMECNYDIDGRILVVPLTGFGSFNSRFNNNRAIITGSGEIVTNKKGVKHLQIKSIKLDLDVGENHTWDIDNKDQRNAAVANAAINFIRQNGNTVIEIITPIVEESLAEVARQYGNDILNTIPYSEILPN